MEESSYLVSKKYGFVWVDSVLGCMKDFTLDKSTRGFFQDRGISVMVNLIGDFDVRNTHSRINSEIHIELEAIYQQCFISKIHHTHTLSLVSTYCNARTAGRFG